MEGRWWWWWWAGGAVRGRCGGGGGVQRLISKGNKPEIDKMREAQVGRIKCFEENFDEGVLL